MKKINQILLIDDDEPTNFFHKIIIREADCCEQVVVMDSAIDALDYLTHPDTSPPDLIFLDINMPKMNGWEFLEAYRDIASTQQSNIIIMLTTSLNPDDQSRADKISAITGFRHKPLSVEMLKELTDKFFSTVQEV